ncbi:MAG: cytochrome c [Calditrichaeota bacterium]|nr:MAG: cytochrome c [Calditrichota bacterium]
MNVQINKLAKRLAIFLTGLIVVLLIVFALIYVISNQRMNKIYAIPEHTVALPTDSASLTYGKRLSQIRGCVDCHGENLAGKIMIDNPIVARLYASNLTPGAGGISKEFKTLDWERAIRHGVRPDGKPLLFMPAHEMFPLSDDDLGALIAYLKSLPPVDNPLPTNSIGPLGRALYLMDKIPLTPAELINHSAQHPSTPVPGITVQYGKYLAIGCTGCHGKDFTGGPIPGAPPEWPKAANLTPAGNLKNWSEADFIKSARTGIKPDGKPFDPVMPYQPLKAMTNEELKAVWLFLTSLPAQ